MSGNENAAGKHWANARGNPRRDYGKSPLHVYPFWRDDLASLDLDSVFRRKERNVHFLAIIVREVLLHILPDIAFFFVDMMLDQFFEHLACGLMLGRRGVGDAFQAL